MKILSHAMVPFILIGSLPALAEGNRDFIHHQILDGKEDEVRHKITKYPSLLNLPYTEDSRVLPLHHAAQVSSPELVKFMIEKGADVDAACYSNFTALHLCRKPETAKILIASGADISIVDSWGHTALQSAALAGRREIAEAMIESGVAVDLLTATALGKTEIAAMLARDNPDLVKPPDEDRRVLHRNETPLGIAASEGNLELVKLYVDLGADVNAFSRYPLGRGGFSPLVNAVGSGNKAVVAFLLEKGADPEVKVGKFGVDLIDAVRQDGDAGMLALLEEAREKKAKGKNNP